MAFSAYSNFLLYLYCSGSAGWNFRRLQLEKQNSKMNWKLKQKPKSYSPGKILWRKFKSNTLAFSGLILLVVFVLAGIMAYLIIPDQSPQSNEQHVEIATRKPGFKVKMLRIRNNEVETKYSLWHKMLSGKKPAFRMVAISSYRFENADIIISEFTGEDEDQDYSSRYSLADVTWALDPGTDPGLDQSGNIRARLITGESVTESLENLRGQIEEFNIIEKK